MHLFSTDIDGTIFDGHESAELFRDFWNSLQPREPRPFLVYNTGRAIGDTLELVEATALPEPDYYICGVGTEIFQASGGCLIGEWLRLLRDGWDLEVVHEAVARLTPARPQPDAAQNPHKCSWYWEDAPQERIAEVVASIESHGIRAQAVYSSNRDLDLLPAAANKGNAVSWLAEFLEVSIERVVVAGDSGNDASMFEVEGVSGVVVANAEQALVSAARSDRVYHAARPVTAGVIEGLTHLLEGRMSA